jgi:hypothetical protein
MVKYRLLSLIPAVVTAMFFGFAGPVMGILYATENRATGGIFCWPLVGAFVGGFASAWLVGMLRAVKPRIVSAAVVHVTVLVTALTTAVAMDRGYRGLDIILTDRAGESVRVDGNRAGQFVGGLMAIAGGWPGAIAAYPFLLLRMRQRSCGKNTGVS